MLAFLILSGCMEDVSPDSNTAETEDFDLVSEFSAQLQGYFTSEEQAQENPNYYAISLRGCPIDVADMDGIHLYIEQAQVGGQPYRQRVYVLDRESGTDDGVRSTIYSLKDENSFVGYCSSTESMEINQDQLLLREGCDVILGWNGVGFEGSTQGESCVSTLNGSSYATSKVFTTPDLIESWDQGWFSNGEQAWGAVDGPYRFNRLD